MQRPARGGDDPRTFWLQTLGCPKNQVDSDKLEGLLASRGLRRAAGPSSADLVVVNTCAFVEEARQESIDTVLALSDCRRRGAELVVTGCLAERHGAEIAEAMPEVDRVAGFGDDLLGPGARAGGHGTPTAGAGAGEGSAVAVELSSRPPRGGGFDLLELPRPPASAPWAYVKVAEGCDRARGFCAIPSFRGPQRSRSMTSILDEVEALGAAEVVLVAQDLASFGRDQGRGTRSLVELLGEVGRRVDRVRCLYLYPSDLDDRLVGAILATGVPYFDLSLQHVSRPLLRRMRRWGDAERFAERIDSIRAVEPRAAFRTNFIVGYPGETERDHDRLLEFLSGTRIDWCGFFPYSREDGTYAAELDGTVPRELVLERMAELSELQDAVTAGLRDEQVGELVDVLVDAPGLGRTYREAPEIDGIVRVPRDLTVGSTVACRVTAAHGTDLTAVPVAAC